MVAISVVLWRVSLESVFALALSDDQYTHILLIVPISVALVFFDWEPYARSRSQSFLKSSQPFSSISAAIVSGLLIVAALVKILVQRRIHLSSDEVLAANMLVLVVLWIAAFLACFGRRAFWQALFPICFLFGLVPLPNFMLNSVVRMLQYGSAAVARLLFVMSGIPAAQKGLLLHIPGLTLAVAPECSSIRSSSILVVITMVLAQLFLHSPWKKAVLVAASIPLAIAKNGLRIFVLGVLATQVDPRFLTGRLHRQGGIVFFLIALAAIFLLLRIMGYWEAKNAKPARSGL
jgi:exosortase